MRRKIYASNAADDKLLLINKEKIGIKLEPSTFCLSKDAAEYERLLKKYNEKYRKSQHYVFYPMLVLAFLTFIPFAWYDYSVDCGVLKILSDSEYKQLQKDLENKEKELKKFEDFLTLNISFNNFMDLENFKENNLKIQENLNNQILNEKSFREDAKKKCDKIKRKFDIPALIISISIIFLSFLLTFKYQDPEKSQLDEFIKKAEIKAKEMENLRKVNFENVKPKAKVCCPVLPRSAKNICYLIRYGKIRKTKFSILKRRYVILSLKKGDNFVVFARQKS